METAIRYTELTTEFIDTLLKAGYKNVEVIKGRRFDRILLNGAVQYFIDHGTMQIYGAKSALQYNPRREYGTLNTVHEYDWQNDTPKQGTALATYLTTRENQIAAAYKKRGRPRKVLVGAP